MNEPLADPVERPRKPRVWHLFALFVIAQAVIIFASGVAIGRNVWQHPHPAGITRALVALVHGGASVTAALAALHA